MTYPKDGEQKLRDTIKQLRMQVSRLRKENSILREELTNIVKPVRPRKESTEQRTPQKMTKDEWRLDFVKRFKPALKKCLEELDNDESSEEDS